MKRQTIYICDHCRSKFNLADEAEVHEAAHYNLSHAEYKEWEKLHKTTVKAGARVGVCKNPESDGAFDKAIQELVDFERDHGLSNEKAPSHWH